MPGDMGSGYSPLLVDNDLVSPIFRARLSFRICGWRAGALGRVGGGPRAGCWLNLEWGGAVA
jgi:hypothetical protein